MKNLTIDKAQAYLITDRLTRKYFCGIDIADGFLVIAKEKTYFVDARYFYAAKENLSKLSINCVLYENEISIKKFLTSLGVKELFIDFDKCTVNDYFTFKNMGFEVLDGSKNIALVKAIKSESEIEFIKKACEIVQSAYEKVIHNLYEGITELEVKDKLEKEMVLLGAEGVSFETIVAFSKNSAVPHHQTGNTKLTQNSVVLIDAGCKVNGYASDLTRTAFFGKPDKKFIDTYNLVLSANILAEEKITSSIPCSVADGFARDRLKEENLDKYFTHSLGHGVGLEIHEYPRLSPKSSEVLEDSMVFTIEPGVYFDGEFGIRIEDTVVLQDGKVNRLFTDDKKLLIL